MVFASEKDDAARLEILGILKGSGNGVNDEYRESVPLRYQAAWLFLRLLGKEEDAKAWKGVRNFTDSLTVRTPAGNPLNAENITMLAYLFSHQDLGLVGFPDGSFRPFSEINAQMYYKLMLVALGYIENTDFTWDNVFAKCVEFGLTSTQPTNSYRFNIDALAAATVQALKAKLKNSPKSLIEKLVRDDKAISEDKAQRAGLVDTVPATTPPPTVPPATDPPVTNPPATNPPATNPPATNPPATTPPATTPPATTPPATTPPATTPPATTPSPTTQGPVVDKSIFPLKVSDNGRYLIDRNGEPFFPVVDTGWMVFSYINEEDAVFYLDQRRENGVNTILCYAAPFMLGTPNAEGEVAFFDDNLSKPNDKYWDYVEHLIGVMAEKGMQVIMCPCEMYQYREKYSVNDAAALGKYLGERFEDVKNLMWFTGGDVHPTPDQVVFSDALAKGIKEFDTEHIISFHPAGGNSSSDYFNDYGWLDYNMVQVFSPDSPMAYTLILDDYEKKPTRPTILIEPCYEDNGANTPYQVRRAISWGVTSGSFGMTYGSKNVYKYILPDWKSMLDRPAFNHFSNIAEMVGSRKWFLLEPDTSGKLIKSGSYNYGSIDYASTSIASDGSFAISYLPTGREITIDMSVFNGGKTVKWFDPTNNTFVTVGTYPSSGTIKLQARPKNSAGDSDWFLVIE